MGDYIDLSPVTRRVDNVHRDVEALQHMAAQLDAAVAQVSATQDLTRGELNDLRTAFTEFLRRDERSKNLQFAQTKLIEVRQSLDTEFGHYAQVRRSAVGTLQAMDAGVVTQAAIQELSEELMISTPRYWLAPALVALGAWLRDDRTLAERALGESLRRDHDKASLFFALVLRRQGRDDATGRWLHQYVARQDPERLANEFTVVVDAAATGALGVAVRPFVVDTMQEWHHRLSARPEIVDAQVERWSSLLGGMRGELDGGFSVLPRVSPTWPALLEAFAKATVFSRAARFFDDVLTGPLPPDPGLATRVDGILDRLTSNYDHDEVPLRRQADELEAVVEHHGDTDAAAAAVTDRASVLDDEVDFLTLISNAAFYPERTGITRSTQRTAIALSKDWVTTAVGRLEADVVTSHPDAVELEIDGWTGTIDAQAGEQDLVRSLRRHEDARTAAEVAAVTLSGAGIAAGIGAGISLLISILTFANRAAGGGVLFLLVFLALGCWTAYAVAQVPARRATVQAAGAKRRDGNTAVLRGAIAEALDWRRRFAIELDAAGALRRRLTGLDPTAHLASTPGHAREVLV